jgi:hypothetical protein
MKTGASYQLMKGLAPHVGGEFTIALMPTACRSIAANLKEQGFDHEARQIMAALDRGDLAAIGH